MRSYHRRNAERIRARVRAWMAAHPEKRRQYEETRRLKRLAQRPPRPRPANPTNLAELGWTAGIIDGEGSIGINSHGPDRYYSLRLSVGMSDANTVAKLQSLWGGTVKFNRRLLVSKRLMHDWRVCSRRAEEVLRAVLAYLVTKRSQAELALEYRELALGKGKIELARAYHDRLIALRKPF